MNVLDLAFATVLSASGRIGLLIVVFLVARRWLRRRLPSGALVGVWLIFGATLVIPVGVPAVWSPFNWVPRVSAGRSATIAVPQALNLAPAVALKSIPAESPTVVRQEKVERPVSIPAAVPDEAGTHPGRWILLIWLLGVVFLASGRMGRAWWFRYRLTRNLRAVDERVTALASRSRSIAGVQRLLPLSESPLAATAALHGLFRPRILLPPGLAGQLSDSELEMVLLHEFGHIRRRDLWTLAVMDAAAILHWFNPLVWLAVGAMRADCEEACDEFVLRRLRDEERLDYGFTLLKLASQAVGTEKTASALGIIDGKHSLKQRIRMISSYSPPRWLWSLAGTALITLVLSCSVTRESAQTTDATADDAAAPAATPAAPAPAAATTAAAGTTAKSDAATTTASTASTTTASTTADDQSNTQHAYDKMTLTPIMNRALLKGGLNFDRGKEIMDTIGCRMCHLFNGGSGGIGPDLSGVGGRFGVYEILESILEPSAVVSDLYGTKIITLNDGSWYTGRIASQNQDSTTLITSYVVDPQTGTATWNGGPTMTIKNSDIWNIEDNPVSPMPPGMIDSLSQSDIADFLAFLISGGNPSNKMFAQPAESN